MQRIMDPRYESERLAAAAGVSSLLREPRFVMQAAEHGSLHHAAPDNQPVSVLVGRGPGRHLCVASQAAAQIVHRCPTLSTRQRVARERVQGVNCCRRGDAADIPITPSRRRLNPGGTPRTGILFRMPSGLRDDGCLASKSGVAPIVEAPRSALACA